MKKILIIGIVILFCFHSEAQRCGCIGGGKDFSNGDINALGILTANDSCTFTFQKPLNNIDSTKNRYNYYFSLSLKNIAETKFTPDDIRQFEIELRDSSIIIWNNVKFKKYSYIKKFSNYEFRCIINEEQLKAISEIPIISITTFGKFKTSFDKKIQKKQIKIVNCIIKEKVVNKIQKSL